MTDNTHKIQLELEKQWREKFPALLSELFAFYQFLCTVAIIGCEVGSILIDLYNATIYVGIWAGLFFMVAWILQAVAVTCRFTRQYAKYTLIVQCITLFFAACVIGFDAYFIINPSTCFFSSTLCNSTKPTRGAFYSEENFNNIKMPLIKGQLGTAAVMFAFSIDYIIIYFVTKSQIKKATQSIPNQVTNDSINTSFKNPMVESVLTTKDNPFNSSSVPFKDRNVSISTVLSLDPPLDKSARHSRWSLDSVD